MNDIANLKVSLTSSSLLPLVLAVPIEHASKSTGAIAVAEGTEPDAEHEIPFGGIKREATGALIVNRTSAPITLKVNGTKTHDIGPGGLALFTGAGAGDKGLANLAFLTTSKQGKPGEKVEYFVFGDPVTAKTS